MMDRATLEAFVDGALTPEEAARVVMHLADTPSDQAYVDALMELDAMLGAAFEAPMSQPVPERILAATRSAAPGNRVVAFRRRVARAAPYLGAAIAAAMVLALGLPMLRQGPADAPGPLEIAGPLDPGTTLQQALETRPSGETLRDAEGSEVVVIATFLDRNGRPCREFEVLNPAEDARTRGIACRAAIPLWTVAYAASKPVSPAAGASSEAEGYAPAAGADDTALTGALDALGAGAGLAPADEGALIASGWRP